MLDPSHIALTRVIVLLVAGIPALWLVVGVCYLAASRRIRRRRVY
jgi:hypothetical protein